MHRLLFPALLYCCTILATLSEDYFHECGIRNDVNRHIPLISHGFEAEYLEFPWHVALYRQYSPDQEPEYICGGSIIHQDLIVTAAHCVYNESLFEVNNATFIVVVGKYYRPWNYMDPNDQKFEVKETRIPATYLGTLNRFADDIAILALNDSIKFSRAIMPVCVDWSSEFYTFEDTILGTVVGWGRTQHGNMSDELMVAKLNYFNFTSCRERVATGFSSFVTSDKFCAGVDNGTSVEQGDSGGGFVVLKNPMKNIERYYLYGIVSTKDTQTKRIAAFTDVNSHLMWINTTIESLSKLGYCTPLQSAKVELTNCSNNKTLISCQVPSQRGTKAKLRCRDSFHLGNPYELHTEVECFQNRKWTPAVTESCIACGLRDKRFTTKAKKRPEPWHVGIYRESDEFQYICGGVLFHPKAILTAAHCVHDWKNVPLYAAIGKRNCSWSVPEILEQRFKISNIFIKPTYIGQKKDYMDDIAILELNRVIKLSEYVMPACIDWSGTLQLYRNPLISGLSMGCGSIYRLGIHGALKTNKLRFIERGLCSEVSLSPLAVDKMCATADDGSDDFELGFSGGSFTFPKYNEETGEQKSYLYGIISYSAHDIVIFTDVTYHLEWIMDILISNIIRN